MADLRLGDTPVLRASITLPRTGVWHVDLLVDTDDPPSGRVTLAGADGAVSLTGTVAAAQVWQARAQVSLVGGAGGFGRALDARFYRAPSVRIVVSDILRECGETLSPTADAGLLSRSLATWARPQGAGGQALSALCEALGAVWRVLPDGSVWVGTETWPNVEVPGDVLDSDTDSGQVILATDTVYGLLAPGATWLDQHVSRVQHAVDEERVRSTVTFEPADAPGERLRGLLDKITRDATRGTLYHALYPATVVEGGSGVLGVRPDGVEIPSMTGVPIRWSSPGESATIAPGARVLIGFEGGDPTRPYVAGFAPDTAGLSAWQVDAPSITLGAGASKAVALHGDGTPVQESWLQWLKGLATKAGYTVPIPPTDIATVRASAFKTKAE